MSRIRNVGVAVANQYESMVRFYNALNTLNGL